jgi:hypothetical protein
MRRISNCLKSLLQPAACFARIPCSIIWVHRYRFVLHSEALASGHTFSVPYRFCCLVRSMKHKV